MIVRKACPADVNSIVNIHMDAFKGFFLTSLEPSFLLFYYSCFINSDETITMVAENNGEIIGFSASSKVAKGFNARLIKKNLFSFGLLSVKMLFTDISSLIRLAKNLSKKSEQVLDDEEYAELYSIGVKNIAQGQGVGKFLLAESESVLKSAGVKKVSLTTDYYNNDKAVGFYNSLGYKIQYVFEAYPNRKMYRLIKSL